MPINFDDNLFKAIKGDLKRKSFFCVSFLAHKVSLKDRSRAGVRPCVRPWVRPCVCEHRLSNMNISEASGPIVIKFYLKHHRGEGKAV